MIFIEFYLCSIDNNCLRLNEWFLEEMAQLQKHMESYLKID
jgi:hypothetical protein